MMVHSKYPKDDDNPNFSTREEDWAARLTFLYFCQEITRTSFGIIPSDNENYSLKFYFVPFNMCIFVVIETNFANSAPFCADIWLGPD